MLLGLGFTFFSGAVEAWLVDAMHGSGYKGEMEAVFGKGQVSTGVGMLIGSVAGGVIAQHTTLGTPMIVRSIILALMFVVAYIFMRDIGFSPQGAAHPWRAVKHTFRSSIDNGLRNRKIKWLMYAAPFSAGIGIYAFYATQPYLLELYGDPHAYTVAGLTAALVAGAQIAGGYLSPKIRKLPYSPITLLIAGVALSTFMLAVIGLAGNFVVALVAIAVWGIIFAAAMPIRQTYINNRIDSKERATILSFDSLMGDAGSVVTQPLLGRAADVWSYGTSFVIAGAIQALAIPLLSRTGKGVKDAK
jgi:MFS family permease